MDRDTHDFLDLLKTLDEHSFTPVRELFNTKVDIDDGVDPLITSALEVLKSRKRGRSG